MPSVLIVDDEPLARQRIRLLLRDEPGLEIVGEAGSGADALAVIARAAPDLVFLDVQMPEMDGYETARRVTERWAAAPAARPRMIAMTGNAMQGDRERCLEAGMDDYISKPVRVEELRAMLERWGAPQPTGAAR